MSTDSLVGYILRKRGEGLTDDAIRAELLSVGWDVRAVDDNFSRLYSGVDIPIPMPETLLSTKVLALKAWGLLWEHVIQIFFVSVLPGILLLVLYSFLLFSYFSDFLNVGSSPFLSPLLSILLEVLTIVVGGFISILVILVALGRGSEKSLFALYGEALRYLPRFVVISFVMVLSLYGGFALFIIPGFIFLYGLYFAPIACIDHNLSIRDSLLYSRAYTRGRLLDILSRIFMIGFFTGLIMLPIVVLGFVISLFSGSAGFIVILPIYFIFIALIGIFMSFFNVVLYQNLRALTGAVDSTHGGRFQAWLIVASVIGAMLMILHLILMASLPSLLRSVPTPANDFTPTESSAFFNQG